MSFEKDVVQLFYYKSLYTTPSYQMQPKHVKYIEVPIKAQQTENNKHKDSKIIVGKSKKIELINLY